MSISRNEARQVAHLARLEVDESDIDSITEELSAIIGFMAQLAEVDIEGVEPMTSVTPMRLSKRADVVASGGIRDRILATAPAVEQGFFTVPKVVE
ncbi:MAG: Asp-tRNA(Asn)/Glu-tRNA(Gln) amidotransferase subunit GatC [Rhodobacteraceae bacterium]|nr:Asp-tRNA(Asn)/Glu-tRNA(Gln) amidotransferase subunit GatC [Paracoccaceae bacterium]